MGEEKTPLALRREWVKQVKDIIENEQFVANAGKIPRVATPLLDAKPEAYIPQFLSLGPYHHWRLEKKIEASSCAGDSYEHSELSAAEKYKVESAATFWRVRRKSLYGIVEMIQEKEMRQEIENFYDLRIGKNGEYPSSHDGEVLEIEESYDFALMMAIDSSFLLRFLFAQSGSLQDGMKCISGLEVSIKCDILKLENQIPFAVLRNVFDRAKEASNDASHEDFSKLLQKTSRKLSPFEQFAIAGTQMNDQPHLLGYVHTVVSPFVQWQKMDQGNWPRRTSFQKIKYFFEAVVAAFFTLLGVRDPVNYDLRPNIPGLQNAGDPANGIRQPMESYNAKELENRGIKFKSFSMHPHGIRFDTYSGTLYLPRITLSGMETDVFLSNMLALEFNDPARGDSVTRYVALMGSLLKNSDDVRILRESRVILCRSPSLTDEKIADMWNGMCPLILPSHQERSEDVNRALEQVIIRKYYVSRVKKVVWESNWNPISNPGRGVALLIGILLLLMSLLQTYFGWADWSHEKSQGYHHRAPAPHHSRHGHDH